MSYNLSFTTNPGYYDLLNDIYVTLRWFYNPEQWKNYSFPNDFFNDFRKYYYFDNNDYLFILFIAIIITIIRYTFEQVICKPLVIRLNFDKKADSDKFYESAWKFIIYTVLWTYCSYILVFSGRYDYFTRPWLIWDDWELNMKIPDDIRLLYFVECGFYVHSVYATLYMDAKRKDTMVMLLHHFLTMVLIIVSYATRYHKIGLLVLYVHDVTDILLEFTKCNVYLKSRNKKVYKVHDYASSIGFATFAFSWFLFRLYWYPLKVLYSSGVIAVHRAFYRGAGLYAFFNTLLLLLLGLNIYWFYFILLLLFRVATGQSKEVNDTREYETDESLAKKKETKQE